MTVAARKPLKKDPTRTKKNATRCLQALDCNVTLSNREAA